MCVRVCARACGRGGGAKGNTPVLTVNVPPVAKVIIYP